MHAIQPIVAFHYGDFSHPNIDMYHPRNEEMIVGRHDYQTFLAARGLRMVVTRRTSDLVDEFQDPHGIAPEVEVDFDPHFEPQANGRDVLVPNWHESRMTLDQLGAALIFDKDVKNFQRSLTPNGSRRKAFGLGIDPMFLLNSLRGQDCGNDKWETHNRILAPLDLGLDTFLANSEGLSALFDKYGDIRTITKPAGLALGEGVQIHEALQDLDEAIEGGDLSPDMLLQPFVSQRRHIPGLKALHPKDKERLREVNVKGDGVVREIRMHFGCYLDAEGHEQSWAYPTLRYNTTDSDIMGALSSMGSVTSFLPLDPESVSPDWQSRALHIATRMRRLTNARQIYGAADGVQGDLAGEPLDYVGEVNSKGPYMPSDAIFARNDLMTMISESAQRNRNFAT